MSHESPIVEKGSPRRLLVPSMVIATAAVSVSSSILTLFLVDVASTFHVSVGIASQLATVNHAGEFVFSILLSILAVRFRYKPLILAGILFALVSAIGNFLAPDFFTMQIFFVMEGIGTVLVSVMSLTLFGDVLSPKKRAKAVSYLVATLWVTALISFPWAGFVANVVGWRSIFILQLLPISLVGLILAFFVVPSKPREPTGIVKKTSYIKSVKQILTNKSATACLAGTILSATGPQVGIFGVALYRKRFSLPLDFTVIFSMVFIVVYIVGSFVAGRLTNRFGAKPIAVVGKLFSGVFTIMFFLFPDLWGAFFFDFLQVCFAAIAHPAYICLVLAQVPKSRGTMMSLNRAMGSLSRTIAPAVGGALLVLTFGFYGVVGLALGGMTVAASVIIFLLAKDPTRT
ncbi:MAG: MFS transporter [Candidatus Bathyarchaeota archaeon]|nr:MFS transporter [Candidatus Bathyarchaeota archaeon]